MALAPPRQIKSSDPVLKRRSRHFAAHSSEGELLLLHFEAKMPVAGTKKRMRGVITDRVIRFDLGPGVDWTEAVVEFEWDNSFVWIEIGEHWDHSQPSPLALWFCLFAELSVVKYEPASQSLTVVTNANEQFKCAIRPEDHAAGLAQEFLDLWKRRN